MSVNPLETLLLGNAAANRFPPNSRYHGAQTRVLTLADGRPVAYLARRFVPPPASLAQRYSVRVVAEDRLDRLAAAHLDDPEMFWRICDANTALRPRDLEAVDTELRIPTPDGMPGGTDG